MTLKIRFTSYSKATDKKAWFFSLTPGSQLLLTVDVGKDILVPVRVAKAVTICGLTLAVVEA